ncbi:hypothetical protein [Actinocorallia longicatena]|uniref:DUF559 domain-containing protein n=1 Tax=Actinocorallia longicatena TaxID=111803 RepID=A0ABP6Q9T9_9ACTN
MSDVPQPALFPADPTSYALLPVSGSGAPAARARLLARAVPARFVLTTRSAAALWGVETLPAGAVAATWPLELAVPAPAPVPAGPRFPPPSCPAREAAAPPGSVVRYAHLPARDVTELQGIRLTTAERTAFDCARRLPRYEALSALDQFLARGVSRESLLARLPRSSGPGTAQAAALIAMADPASGSPAESLVRGTFVDAGFPRPRCQLTAPPTAYRLDLGHPEYLVAAEYNGEAHHTGREARLRDSLRRRTLTDLGWRILPVTKDFRTAPAPYLDAWLHLLMAAGWNPTPQQLAHITARLTRLRHRR